MKLKKIGGVQFSVGLIIWMTCATLLPIVEISLQVMEIDHDPDRMWNAILNDGAKFPPEFPTGSFTPSMVERLFADHELDSSELQSLKVDLKRSYVTKGHLHGFNILCILVTGFMIYFFEYRWLVGTTEFIKKKSGILMSCCLVFFIVMGIIGTILMIIIRKNEADLDDHQALFDKALVNLAKNIKDKNLDAKDANTSPSTEPTGKKIKLSLPTWFLIILDCRRNEGDQPSVEQALKHANVDTSGVSNLIAWAKAREIKKLSLVEWEGKDYDIMWLRNFLVCPVDPRDYLSMGIVEIILNCLCPVIFFGCKVIMYYFCSKKVEPEGEGGEVNAEAEEADSGTKADTKKGEDGTLSDHLSNIKSDHATPEATSV